MQQHTINRKDSLRGTVVFADQKAILTSASCSIKILFKEKEKQPQINIVSLARLKPQQKKLLASLLLNLLVLKSTLF